MGGGGGGAYSESCTREARFLTRWDQDEFHDQEENREEEEEEEEFIQNRTRARQEERVCMRDFVG